CRHSAGEFTPAAAIPAICTNSVVFSTRRRHTSSPRDWSSDVCSSDLTLRLPAGAQAQCGIQAPGNKAANTQNQPLSQRGLERIEIGRASGRQRAKREAISECLNSVGDFRPDYERPEICTK